jgi:hypothetical protein
VSEKELDLLQFASCGMAQLRAGATEVMRSEPRKPELLRVIFDDVPNDPFRHALAPVFACSTDATKHFPG